MPLVYQHNINASTRLGVWHITEPESFFSGRIRLQRSITHPHKRLQHLAGRLLLTELFPEFPVTLIEVADTRKPFLPGDPFHFSISHCGGYAAAVVSTVNRVGVDIETVTQKILRIQPRFLLPEEQIHNDSGLTGAALFTLCWSAKEAVYKWFALPGLDFRRNMRIQYIGKESLQMQLTGLMETELTLTYLFFGEECLCWVVS